MKVIDGEKGIILETDYPILVQFDDKCYYTIFADKELIYYSHPDRGNIHGGFLRLVEPIVKQQN